LQLSDNKVREPAKGLELLIVEQTGAVIGDAQRADPASVGEGQRHPGVEANPDRTGHNGVVGEPRVLQGVRDLEDVGAEDRVCAERLARWVSMARNRPWP
jgi:hypothetical protein